LATVAWAGVVFAGCQSPPVASTPQQPSKPRPRAAAPAEEMPCDAHFESKGVMADDLSSLTRMCSTPHRELELSPAREGRQAQSDSVDRYFFTAERGRCFRIYAVGDGDIADLDVQLVAPDGRVLASDQTHRGQAVAPPSAAACVPATGTYTVEVSTARGEGRYLMQVWAR